MPQRSIARVYNQLCKIVALTHQICYLLVNMANTNVEVTKNNNENTVNLVRRFTKRVQGAGILRRVRGIRYAERDFSKFVTKKAALKRISKTAEIEKLKKEGKFIEPKRGRRR